MSQEARAQATRWHLRPAALHPTSSSSSQSLRNTPRSNLFHPKLTEHLCVMCASSLRLYLNAAFSSITVKRDRMTRNKRATERGRACEEGGPLFRNCVRTKCRLTQRQNQEKCQRTRTVRSSVGETEAQNSAVTREHGDSSVVGGIPGSTCTIRGHNQEGLQ